MGYGGQCRILSSFFKLKSYTLIDLKPVLGLAQKYLDNYPLNTVIEYKTMKEINSIVESRQRIQLMCNYPNYAALILKKKYNISSKVVGNSVILPLKEANIAVVVSYLTYKKVKIYGLKKIQKSLEELYFELLNSERPSTSIV